MMFPFLNFISHSGTQPRLESCKFCDVSTTKGFKIVWEVRRIMIPGLMLYGAPFILTLSQDETFVAFEDIKPAAMHHLQLVPKKHIGETLNHSCISATMLNLA